MYNINEKQKKNKMVKVIYDRVKSDRVRNDQVRNDRDRNDSKLEMIGSRNSISFYCIRNFIRLLFQLNSKTYQLKQYNFETNNYKI